MIEGEEFCKLLKKKGSTFFTGVPDSLLRDFIVCLDDQKGLSHTIAANEGGAIALAAGHYMANRKPAVVYMQNSGLGNAINPLTSLADTSVYSIPILLLIGWRGKPGVPDEPQHIKKGKITQKILETLEIPHAILPSTKKEAQKVIDTAYRYMEKHSSPYAILVNKNTFSRSGKAQKRKKKYTLSRENTLQVILDELSPRDVVVATTGKISRELFELREERKEGHEKDFLTVGSMGHASDIAAGIAHAKRRKRVWCLDGDGSVIMHMGHLSVIGKLAPPNFIHVVFNNEAHDSVGGQKTSGDKTDFAAVAKACGYAHVCTAQTEDSLRQCLTSSKKKKGPVLIEVKIQCGARSKLGRPTRTPKENLHDFMQFLEGE